MRRVRPEDWQPQGVDELEDRAWEALRMVDRSVCVTAGAGAGKTEFLAQKAAYLLQTGLCPAPKRILAISFKRDAARNLAERVEARCEPEQSRRFASMTFDAFTKHMVDQFRMAIPAEFRPTADYEIVPINRDQIEAFLARTDAANVRTDKFERALELGKLPIAEHEDHELKVRLLTAYWQERYEDPDRTYLNFAMLNRLTELLLRKNPRIRASLRQTYPFVFLDEFQDTTKAQFQLLTDAFDPARTIFTAVGDDKQKIMGWAGAMSGAFARFQEAFAGECVPLLSNWRSHADLVAIQHVVARQIDEHVEPAVAKKVRVVDGDVAAIWAFDDRDEEINSLADWIAAEIAIGEVAPHQIAVLGRMRVDRIEDELGPALADRDVILRNVARFVGGIAIQDVLAEEFTELMLAILRLGAGGRQPDAWATLEANLRRLEAIDDEDENGGQRLAARMQEISVLARKLMRETDATEENVAELLGELLGEVGETLVRELSPSYQRDADYERVKTGFVKLLEESARPADGWEAALDRFKGIKQVPLMTIHKSKGLEFHTMIFFGLDDRSWRYLRPEEAEELNAFFVAFTRAEQRAFFSCCEARGGRIEWLEDLLGQMVPRGRPA